VNVFGTAHIEKLHFKGVFVFILTKFDEIRREQVYKKEQPVVVGLNP
jgi:hypothetical protein